MYYVSYDIKSMTVKSMVNVRLPQQSTKTFLTRNEFKKEKLLRISFVEFQFKKLDINKKSRSKNSVNIFSSFIRLFVLIMTSLNSRFQRKNRF